MRLWPIMTRRILLVRRVSGAGEGSGAWSSHYRATIEQRVSGRILDYSIVRPIRRPGSGRRKIVSPSVRKMVSLDSRILVRMFTLTEALETTKSAPTTCNWATLSSLSARIEEKKAPSLDLPEVCS